MWRQAHLNTVVEHTLAFTNFPESFGKVTVFFISDIHRRVISPKMIEQVRGKAEIVIIGGDLAEKGVELEQIKNNLDQLKQIGPIYFVWGNNDYEVNFRDLDALLIDNHVKILDNTAYTFESENGDKLILLGVDDMSNRRDRLDLALKDSGVGFRILVSHDPRIVSKVSAHDNISLVLSGHTHGGQIRFFKWGIYERGGITKLTHTTLFVSNGYGTTAIPLRLGAPCETHLITLTQK